MAKVSRKPAAAERRAQPRQDPPALPGWLPPVIYAFVTLLLFREFFLGGASMLGVDSITLSYFARDFYTEFVQQFHRMPYWNPLLFGGLPFVEAMHGDIFYPPSLALFFMDARTMWGWKMALHIFMAGAFMYFWLRRGLALGGLAAFFGGLVYMMGADLVSLVLPGGDGKLFVAALAPLMFWLTERAAARRGPADYALFALGLALILFTSHMQSAYYCVWAVSLYFLFRVWQMWRSERNGGAALRAVGTFALAGVLGVGAAAVQFLPPLGYLREHSHRVDRAQERGYEWSSTYSLHAEEIVSLAIPEFIGEVAASDPSRPAGGYWGRNGFKLNHEYAGLVPLLLIPVLLVLRRTPQVWFFTALAALALLYALASSTPFGRFFYIIPGVSMFRAWSIIIYVYALAVVTLGAIGVQQLHDWLLDARSDAEAATARKTLWVTAGVFAVLALLASSGVLASLWTGVVHRSMDARSAAIMAANSAYITTGFWVAFGIALAVAGAWHAATRRVLSAGVFVVVVAVVAAVDLYRVGRPFVKQTAQMNEQLAATTMLRPDDVITQLQRLRDAGGVFRVGDLSAPLQTRGAYNANDLAIHGLEQLAGHHGNEMGRYRNLIGGDGADNLATSDLRLANITNTEYFVSPARVEHPALEEIYTGQYAVLYRNRDVLPRAYVVGATEVVAADAAIERLLDEDFDARNVALLEEPLPQEVEVQAGATGAVEWMERGADGQRLRVTADRAALLMVLDNWLPAWEATVGGRAAPVLRANHTFRAIPVPPGEHVVTLRYRADTLRSGAFISLAVLALLLGVVLVDTIRSRRRVARA
jgi:hypothetical protein